MKTLLLSLLCTCAASAFVVNQNEVLADILVPGIPIDVSKLTGEPLVEYVNRVQNSFKATFNKKARRLMNKKFVKAPEIRAAELQILATIPDAFDSRANWPQCSSMNLIHDQSNCGSDWALAAAEAMSDRVCVNNNGASNPLLSAGDIFSCCKSCGAGCGGGYPIQAWRYWVSNGIVTEACYGDDGDVEVSTPNCTAKCVDGYPKSYADDKIFGQSAYAVQSSVSAIQKEIMTYGPVEATFTVYEDFYHYTSGIYVHTAGVELGAHAVKIIGWGVDGKTPYWLAANSWNTDWGEQGYFRIIRGTDECGIEEAITTGLPA